MSAHKCTQNPEGEYFRFHVIYEQRCELFLNSYISSKMHIILGGSGHKGAQRGGVGDVKGETRDDLDCRRPALHSDFDI